MLAQLRDDILDPSRKAIFKKLKPFRPNWILVGGTALALQLGHRRSVDFDLFSNKERPRNFLITVSRLLGRNVKLTYETPEQLNIKLPGEIKVTFFTFPFSALHPAVKTDSVSLRAIPDIASEKAYAFGQRATWRDYVDMFFLLRQGLRLEVIIAEAKKRFGDLFNPKLFLGQLTYFDDIEIVPVDFVDQKFTTGEIQKGLIKAAQQYLSSEAIKD